MSIKDIPSQFRIDSEEDLRAMVHAYCSELGFDADEISCEDYFSINLGHHAIDIDKKIVGGRSDILISRDGKPLAIVETKAPAHDLTKEDAQQAISYARLLATIAPFAIVTNGKNTKVYDVLEGGLTEIDNPLGSRWYQHGQQISGIADELRYEAAKILIAVNPDTLSKFCEEQVATGLIDLRSNVVKNKKYIPDVYVERQSLSKTFGEWLQSELPVFAVVAPSGYGKTNFMCAEAEKLVTDNFVLFYSASRFTGGFINSIRNDFIWEFHREREIPQIIDRLDTISRNTGKKLLFFVDAIDENLSGIKAIKNELLDFVAKLRQYPNIRLILSCKSFDWHYVVTDSNQSFNLLAETIDPSCCQPQTHSLVPDSEKVGFHLVEFTDAELDQAIAKYKTAYSIDGAFYGEILTESRNPLMLRFIAEIYGGEKEKLPTSISSLELFNLYSRRKLELIENYGIAEIILSKLGTLIFVSGTRSVPKDEIISNFTWSEGYETSLQNLFRLGILSKTNFDEQETVGFEFNKFLLYFYVFKVRKLQTLSSENQISIIQELLQTRIGIEAIEFYLVAANQGVAHALLVKLADQDLAMFAKVITGLKGIDNYKKSPIPSDHILHYLEFYNFLRNKFFDRLMNATMPYTETSLGVIFWGTGVMQFRACTNAYPHNVRVDNDELIKQVFNGPINKQVTQDLVPVGAVHLGGIHEFAEYPQKAAYKHLTREVSSALFNRVLNESITRDILQERIYRILLYEPSIWLSGDDLPHDHYWKILGYTSIEELGNSKISELSDRINVLINKFSPHLKNSNDNLYPSYRYRLDELFATIFALSQLSGNNSLGFQQYSLDNLWMQGSRIIEPMIAEVEKLVPIIIKNYKLLFAANFPSLSKHSEFLSHIDKLRIVEISQSGGYSDFPSLSYIVCPDSTETFPIQIVSTSHEHSLTDKLYFKSLYGEGYSQSLDAGCGYIKLDTTVNNVRICDPQAWVIKTRFPSRTPILDQVYLLISHDLKSILNAEHMNWKDDLSPRIVNDQYLRIAAESILRRQ